MIASYIANSRKTEVFESINGKILVLYQVTSMMTKNPALQVFRRSKRGWKKIKADLLKNAHMSGVTKNQWQFLKEMSALPVNPVFGTWHFACVRQSVDVYAIPKVESLHKPSLKVSRSMIECIRNRSCD